MSIFCKKQMRWGGFLLLLGTTLNIYQRIQGNSRRHLDSVEVSPNRGFGTHFVTVSLGSPPQSFQLAVAIESDHTSLPCRGCDTCGNGILFDYREYSINKCPYDCAYQASSCESENDSACHITVNYSDHVDASGYTGVEITDTVGIYSSSSSLDAEQNHEQLAGFPLHFICQQESFGKVHRADGILGLSNSEMSFVNQLYKAEQIDQPIFSLCFRLFDDYKDEDSSAGHVTFGHVDRNLLDSPLVWADNQAYPNSQGIYALHLRRIYMGRGDSSNMLTAFSRGTLSAMPIDSSNDGLDVRADYSNMDGTSGVVPIQTNEPITYLHTGVENAFKTAFKYLTKKDYTTPFFELTKEEYFKLPTVFIQIESQQAEMFVDTIVADVVTGLVGHHFDPDRPFDVIVAIPPENYILYSDGKAFPMIYFEQDARLASNILQNYEIVFDLSRQRIGFAQRYKCPAGLSIKHTEVCTEDSRTCDDGSVVRRDPSNNCEFKLCPRTSVTTRSGSGLEKQKDNAVFGEQKASGINMEMDGKGASKSKYETNTGKYSTNEGGFGPSSIHQNLNGLLVKDRTGSLPLAEGGSIKAPRIGPAAIKAEKILTKQNQKHSSGISSAEWSLLGFFLFIFAFFLTVFLTQDTTTGDRNNPFLAINSDSLEDDADNAIKAWEKGISFYSKDATAKRRDPSLTGHDRPYWDLSASSGMDSSSKNKSSFGSFGKLKSFYSTSSSDSPGTRSFSNRPYYQFQKSAKSMISEGTQDLKPKHQPGYDRRQSWIKFHGKSKPHDQPELRKYVKPVNADDRSIFTRSSRGGSSVISTSQSSLVSYEEGGDHHGVSTDTQTPPRYANESEISRAQTILTRSSTTGSSRKPPRYANESEISRAQTILTRSSTTGSSRKPPRYANESEISRAQTIFTRSSITGSSRIASNQGSTYSHGKGDNYKNISNALGPDQQLPQHHMDLIESENSRDETIATKSSGGSSLRTYDQNVSHLQREGDR